MIWLTWRQFRISALTVFGVLGAVALAIVLTGPRLSREYADLRVACGGNACGPEAFDDFLFSHLGVYVELGVLVMAMPVVVGVFWGAPPDQPRVSRPERKIWSGSKAFRAAAGWPSSSASSGWPRSPPQDWPSWRSAGGHVRSTPPPSAACPA